MGLDKVKHNLHLGSGVGPADTHASGDVPETSGLEGGQPREGGNSPARGLRNVPDRSTRGRGHDPDKHARVQDVLYEGKQKIQQLLERTGDALGNRVRHTRGDDHVPPGQAKKYQDGGHTDLRDTNRTEVRDLRESRVPSNGDGEHGRSHETHGRGHDDRGDRVQGFGRGDEEHGRSNFRSSSTDPNGNANGLDNSHGRGHGRDALNVSNEALGLTPEALRGLNVSSVVAYLRGDASGAQLPRELRQVLDSTSRLLGSDLLGALERRGASGDDKHAVKILEHALARVARTLERVAEPGGTAPTNVTPRVYGEAVGELVAATMLDKYFRRAETTGSRVVAQAEAALARLLYGDGRGEGNGRPGVYELPRRSGLPAPHPLEVLRDLQAGAFRPVEVSSRSPFPLSGRALVATEMMELMRTLDAVDLLTRELLTAARGGATSALPSSIPNEGEEAPLLALLRTLAGTAGGAEVIDELLALLPPTMPGRAARMEIPRLVAALGGMLTDTEGHAFVTKEGVPLKLDQLMWLGSLGGVLKSVATGAESFPVRLSPLLIYGFDAVYSLIGFDGRTLNPPHFAAVQAQVNGSELEWVYGQPPLSEGWMRALIERLKDSAQAEHNLLGEMLEEALTDGRFHAALVGGTVSEGEAQPDTFAVTRLLPATA